MVSILRSDVVQAREAVGPGMRPWERSGSVDIEVLAQWAYGVQMVERFERSGLHAIEAAAAGFEPHGMSRDGVGQLMQIEHMGCRIDRGGVTVRDAVHPAALALAAGLAGVENGDRVRYHARSGTRPADWIVPERKARARVWIKPWESAMVEYQGPGKKGAYCPVIITWDVGREEWGRAEYRKWWQALADLAWHMSSRALGFVVTGPAIAAEPWRQAGAPPNGSSQRPSPK